MARITARVRDSGNINRKQLIEDIQSSYIRELGGDGANLDNKKTVVNEMIKILINYFPLWSLLSTEFSGIVCTLSV